MKNNSTFKRGSGVYECLMCRKKTRDTGGDNTDLRLCANCYEIAGIENAIEDGHSTPELVAELAQRKAAWITNN